jgi:hypothetical protein
MTHKINPWTDNDMLESTSERRHNSTLFGHGTDGKKEGSQSARSTHGLLQPHPKLRRGAPDEGLQGRRRQRLHHGRPTTRGSRQIQELLRQVRVSHTSSLPPAFPPDVTVY